MLKVWVVLSSLLLLSGDVFSDEKMCVITSLYSAVSSDQDIKYKKLSAALEQNLFTLYSKTNINPHKNFGLKNFFNRLAGIKQTRSKQHNQAVLNFLNSLETTPNMGRKTEIDIDVADDVLQKVMASPVTSTFKTYKYDPTDSGIGYCFGRATSVHLRLIDAGIDKKSIRKLFALGKLKTSDTNWRYHVTTIVKTKGGEWLALDPIFGSAMTVEQWYKTMQTYDSDGKMLLFTTEAKRFGPSVGQYQRSYFENEAYNGYFIDLIDELKKERLLKASD